MQPNDSLERSLSRRMFFLSGVQGLAACGLLSRLYYLQFIKSEEYKTLSEGNRIKVQLIAPARGDLLDRTGAALAENNINYRLFIERENRTQAQQSLKKIFELVEFSPERKAQLDKDVNDRFNRKPMLVREYLSWDELTRIEFHMTDLPGAYIEEGQLRAYPLIDKASHLIGYVGRVSEAEMQDKDKPLFRLPEFKIGKNGAEVLLEERLQGTAGARHVEVNVSGLAVRTLKYQPSIKGEDIHLSIDAELQRFAAERMGEESGAIVVMDAHYGEVLALASMPAFDPNTFSLGITNTYWKELNANEKNPLLNKAISGLYPPGSTFKMVIGLAGLKAGIINQNTSFYCPGHFNIGNHRWNCWKPEGHGTMNLANALAESCDTYFYHVADRLGIERMADMCLELGLGAKTDLGLPGEKPGLVPTPDWKKQRFGVPWQRGDTINASIGQGFVLASPLQLAVMTARLVNGGRKISPTLLPAQGSSEDKWPLLDVDDSHLELIRDGMYRVCNAGNGTAYWRSIRNKPEFEMGGKTGTSQVRRITQRGMDQSKIPWKYRHHGLFVGYAPAYNPRFVCSVVVEHGGGGSSAAAPVAADVLLKVQELAAANPNRYKG